MKEKKKLDMWRYLISCLPFKKKKKKEGKKNKGDKMK